MMMVPVSTTMIKVTNPSNPSNNKNCGNERCAEIRFPSHCWTFQLDNMAVQTNNNNAILFKLEEIKIDDQETISLAFSKAAAVGFSPLSIWAMAVILSSLSNSRIDVATTLF